MKKNVNELLLNDKEFQRAIYRNDFENKEVIVLEIKEDVYKLKIDNEIYFYDSNDFYTEDDMISSILSKKNSLLTKKQAVTFCDDFKKIADVFNLEKVKKCIEYFNDAFNNDFKLKIHTYWTSNKLFSGSESYHFNENADTVCIGLSKKEISNNKTLKTIWDEKKYWNEWDIEIEVPKSSLDIPIREGAVRVYRDSYIVHNKIYLIKYIRELYLNSSRGIVEEYDDEYEWEGIFLGSLPPIEPTIITEKEFKALPVII